MSTINSKDNTTVIPGHDGYYKCPVTGCNASYRRKEHLQRHRVKHSQQEPFKCPNCPREFGRRCVAFCLSVAESINFIFNFGANIM